MIRFSTVSIYFGENQEKKTEWKLNNIILRETDRTQKKKEFPSIQ